MVGISDEDSVAVVGLDRKEYSAIEGNTLGICVEAISGNFSVDHVVMLHVEIELSKNFMSYYCSNNVYVALP